MKYEDAMRIIEGRPRGFSVRFDRAGDRDYFPGPNEPLIPTFGQALSMARTFASKTRGRCTNIEVVEHDAMGEWICAARIANLGAQRIGDEYDPA